MRAATLALSLLLAACSGESLVSKSAPPTLVVDPLPRMKSFATARMPSTRRSNAEIARDFLDLAFAMESGRPVPVLTRFEEPVTLALTGVVPATAAADLARLEARLRAEAGIDLRRVEGPAAVTIEFVPRGTMQGLVPMAACFVVPRVSSFAEYRASRREALVDWTTLTRRERVAIFVPSDTSPQEVRDCLHEELAQALGPLNDLYRLSDSVFNDDNFHTVLTGFDMLILRTYYAPELRSGMTREEVARALPGILARLNPGGGGGGVAPPLPTPRPWIDAVEVALGPSGSGNRRREAAAQALGIARQEGWRDSRLAFSYFALARLSLASEVEQAVIGFTEAARIYRGLPEGEIHAAHIDMQMAAFALSSGQLPEAMELCDRAIPVVRAAENAALLATLLMIRSEVLGLMGRPVEARAARLDSLGWARYGFGPDAEVRARLSEIAVLTPPVNRG